MEKEGQQYNQSEFHKSEELEDYSEVDSGIQELSQGLDKLPFVSTISGICCEGHLRNNLGPNSLSDERPENGYSFLFGGQLFFYIDKTDPKTSILIEKINQLIEKYPFASIHEHHCNEEKCLIEGSQCIELDHSDLTLADTITDDDSLETMHKKRFQVPTKIGQERVDAYHQFWSELNKIVKESL